MIISPPGDRETADVVVWRSVGIGNHGGLRGSVVRNIVNTCKSGCVFDSVNAGRIGDTGVQPERSELVETVNDAFAVMVKVDTKAASDGGLFVGSIDNRQPRREVCFLLGPEPRSMVCGATGTELKEWFVHLPVERGSVSLPVPRIGIDGWRNLL